MTPVRHRAAIAVGSTLAAALLVVALIGQFVWHEYAEAADTLAEVAPRQARYLGLREADALLDLRLREARAALGSLGYGAERDAAQVGNDLQQTVRGALQAAGLTITTSQVQPTRTEADVERISVATQAEGPLDGLQQALAALQRVTPTLAIDSIVVQPTPRTADNGMPVVASRIVVTASRLAR